MHAIRNNSQRFSPIDTLWWNLDKPTNLAVINGVITFEQPVDFERLKATIETRLLRYSRFQQRVREPSISIGLPYWEDDPNFDIKEHLDRKKFAIQVTPVKLQEMVSELISVPLDRSKPLWHFLLIENYGQGSALIVRMHHCMADGLASVQILLSVTDHSPNAPWPVQASEGQKELSPLARMLRPGVKATLSLADMWHKGERLIDRGIDAITTPAPIHKSIEFSKKSVMSLGKLLLIPPDPKTILRGECSVPKRAVWSEPIPLEDIKEIGKCIEGTVNDVLLSALTGALRSYLQEHENIVDGINIRAVVPVNLRSTESLHKMGNYFGVVFLTLPVGITDSKKRQIVLKHQMEIIKDSPEALITLGLLGAIGLTPKKFENYITDLLGQKASVAMTNVPGPHQPLYVGRSKINGLMFWVPTPANLSLGISIISYSGQVLIGVMADAGIIPDPEDIVLNYQKELSQMKNRVKISGSNKSEKTEKFSQETKSKELLTKAATQKVEPIMTDTQEKPIRCQAQTKSGRRCKNRALKDAEYCQVHITANRI